MAGYPRTTGDVDLLIDASRENEAKVFAALATLSDGCVRELDPGDVSKYLVVRVAGNHVSGFEISRKAAEQRDSINSKTVFLRVFVLSV